ncbi:MAG: glycosyltransferase family 4 protein [Actinomycetia bacterium]|nr:glycosyltransferase family 4 protein [Actinomycetes bacterium]
MKILIINSLYYPNIIGGAEISVQILAEELYKKGHEPIVITISNREYIDVINHVRIYYIHHSNQYFFKISETKSKSLRLLWNLIDIYNPNIAKKLNKIIKSEKPHIAHTNNLLGLSVSVWRIIRRNRIPIIHTTRDYYLLCRKSSMFNKGRNCNSQCFSCRLISILKKYYSKYVDAVIGISSFILKKHLDYNFFMNARSYVINNPVSYLHEMNRNKKDKMITFAYVGTLSDSKGVELLLKTFASIKEARLRVFGKNRDKKIEVMLKEKYNRKNIDFPGYIEAKKIFKQIDVLIVPSLWNEPLSRVIIEAYSNGIPVIASNRGGIPEIVDEGQTGWVFDPEGEKDLEIKIKKFINEPGLIRKMSKNCLKKAEEFAIDKIASKYIEVYKATISKNRYKKRLPLK